MRIVRELIRLANPFAHLGERVYSFSLPVFVLLPFTIALELFVNNILKNPAAVAPYAVFVYAAFIVYFSFRVGISGGVSAVLFTIAYYLYIIYSRNYAGEQLEAGLTTTLILGIFYFIMALVIGGLKERIDILIEREANERVRLQTIMRQLPVGVVITDSRGKVTESNEQVRGIIGEDLGSGYKIGEDESRLHNPHTGKPVGREDSPILQSLRTGKVVKNREFLVKRPGKRTRHVFLNSSPVYGHKNDLIAGVTILQDITLIRDLERKKEDFMNMASHELKTPVTGLILYQDLLEQGIKAKNYKKTREAASGIAKQTRALEELMNELLDVSRVQTGKIQFNKDKFVLARVIEEVIASNNGRKGDQKIRFRKKARVEVYADRMRIYQVVGNLIANAKKYSYGKGDIIVTLAKKGNWAQVSVKDYGVGIKKSKQKKIFDRLYQVSSETAGSLPGFGMGLYISKVFINKHGGKIWVESTEGKGSTFYFTLPI